MTSKRNQTAILLAILAAIAPACGDDGAACGAGTVERDGRCEPVIGGCVGTVDATGTCVLPCVAGEAWDPATGQCVAAVACSPGTVAEGGLCVPACAPTEHWDGAACVEGPACASGTVVSESGDGCVPGPDSCGPGTHLENDSCVPDATGCEDGTHLVDGQCVPELLPEPDVAESPTGVAEFELPGVGDEVALGGNVDAPDQNGYPDWDDFAFEAPAGTWLRLSATSDGAALPAFFVLSEATDAGGYPLFARYAVNPNGRDCAREIYLPYAGRYRIAVSDYTNATAELFGILALPVGGDDFHYQVVVENLGVPAPTVLGPYPATVTDALSDGALRFYRMTNLVLDDAFDVTSASPDDEPNDLFRALMVFDPNGALIRHRASGTTSGAPRTIFAALDAGDYLVVQDHLLTLGPRVDFELTAAALTPTHCGVVDCSTGALPPDARALLRWDLAPNDLFTAGVSLPDGAAGRVSVVFLDRGLAAITGSTQATASATAKHQQFAEQSGRVHALLLNEYATDVPVYQVDARVLATPALQAGQLNTNLTVASMPAETYDPGGFAHIAAAAGQLLVTRDFATTSGSWVSPLEQWLTPALQSSGPPVDLVTITWPLSAVPPLLAWSPTGGTLLHRAGDQPGSDISGSTYEVTPYALDPGDLGVLPGGATLEALAQSLHTGAGVTVLRYESTVDQDAIVTVTPAATATLQPDVWLLVPGALESPGSSNWVPNATGTRLAGLARATAPAPGAAATVAWTAPYAGPCFILVAHTDSDIPADEFDVSVVQSP